ncbi:helix-turn-helix domain-containing protein [Halogeometricum sp. S1BR25-6]|uniref:Helix-turn-helix domain-containing protein n=1 Tax=Halogeometricum salsisoli TaxID=2950536 RepID=A0ABU2GAZ6_9EURY|nr:helix-turn-helix domain-containing protein [Halogeometricum sp. S1BR25-6]MDS0297978.1 helix-turn-helix domain-containing protein [Halogeometricum sp. S1BR25-6]
MSVIVELCIQPSEFELGRVLDLDWGTRVELETLVPLGEDAVPFFLVYDCDRDPEALSASMETHPSVQRVSVVDVFRDRVRFALEWDLGEDVLFHGLAAAGARLFSARGAFNEWRLEIHFPTHRALSSFRTTCEEADVSLDIERVCSADEASAGPWDELTDVQRETLLIAVDEGYYDIPRRCTTVELADKLGVSDQAVTERLRRAIVSLVTATLVTAEG